MKLKIYPDPALKQKCVDVQIGDNSAGEILREMSKYMYEWEGVGLAAPQVGLSKKLIVVDVREEPQTLYKMINPTIIWKSDELVESEEGCLSLPMLRENILRHEKVEVAYLDENFKEREIKADGLLARCLQHEIDHLFGKVYIDRLSRLKKAFALKKFAKLMREVERANEIKEVKSGDVACD